MKIGLLHFRVGETDGVSLEMEKWKLVLEELGHEVHYIAGSLGDTYGYEVHLLAYDEPNNLKIKKLAFENLNGFPNLKGEILSLKDRIKSQLERLPKFDLIIGNNIWSLPHNLSASIAVYEYCKENNIKMVGHHHDFYFEREYYSKPTTKFVQDILNKYFPPRDMEHVTINSLAQFSLLKMKNLRSIVVQNVFDFNKKLWKKDSYNSLILKTLNLKENDIIFLQATRIVRRKAIELAIDTLNKINNVKSNYYGRETATGKIINEDTKFVMVLPGLNEEPSYKEIIMEHAKSKDVNLVFASDICDAQRSESNGIFSLWDFYTIADFVTYPSAKEGFGNQFLEAVFAKKPILVFEYPVFEADIKKMGFKVVSLGNKIYFNHDLYEVKDDIQNNSARLIMELLVDKDKYLNTVNTNFSVGKDHFSYKALSKLLLELIKHLK
jgi:glycosyltransferase involved in cell wall biosynthesis